MWTARRKTRPARSHLNVRIYHDEKAYARVLQPPTHQPTTGHKIKSNANVVCTMILTLPKELSGGTPDQKEAWVERTRDWLQEECPGRLASATLHLDEGRLHIHAWLLPEDDRGHLSYRTHFSGRGKLRAMHRSYEQTLEPLGVVLNSDLVKAVRQPHYTRGMNGWQLPYAVHEATEHIRAKEHEAEQTVRDRLQELDALVRPQQAKQGRKKRKELDAENHVLRAKLRAATQRAQAAEKREAEVRHREAQKTAELNRAEQLLMQRAPTQDWPELQRQAQGIGAQHIAQTVKRLIEAKRAMQAYRIQRERMREQERKLGL